MQQIKITIAKFAPLLFLFFSVQELQAQRADVNQLAATKTTIAGWVENGWIGDPPIKIKVKLDTGAKSSSINAPVYREFLKDGQPHVSFTLINNEGHEVNVEKQVVRMVTIRRAGSKRQQRPVIVLKICVAGVVSETEFTLADRTEMNYPVLIGRRFLAEKIVVDPGRTFLQSGLCSRG